MYTEPMKKKINDSYKLLNEKCLEEAQRETRNPVYREKK
jgi:hypothetical protein